MDEYEEPEIKCTRCNMVLHGKEERNVGQCLPCFIEMMRDDDDDDQGGSIDPFA